MIIKWTLHFKWISVGFLILSVISHVNARRILSVFPTPSLSHLLVHIAVAEALAEAGHNVTVIAPVRVPYKNTNITYIHIDEPLFSKDFAHEMVNKKAPRYQKVANIISQVLTMANVTLNNPKMLDFLQNHRAGDFDALILGYAVNDFILGLGAHFQCPIVLSVTVQPIFAVNTIIGNPVEASYVPGLLGGLRQPMDFWTRIKSYMITFFEYHIFTRIFSRKMQIFYR